MGRVLLAALPERATQRRLPAIPGVVPGQFDRPRSVQSNSASRIAGRRLRRVFGVSDGTQRGGTSVAVETQ